MRTVRAQLIGTIITNTTITSNNTTTSTGDSSAGIRIEDIIEAVSCCVTSIDDELAMERAVDPVIQMIYEEVA